MPPLIRTKRGVQLTSAGEAFLIETKKIITQVDLAIASAQHVHNGVGEQLNICFVSAAIVEMSPVIFKSFQERYPLIKKLQNIVTSEQIQALHEDRIQIGILHPPILNTSLNLELTC